ncbi:MAG TPA: hypothetical protein VFS36_08090 [Chitinophagaceae bacterium]|nr:hypothetical protein [Chitinophagaceae bacterium]
MSLNLIFYRSYVWRLIQFASSGLLNIYLAYTFGAQLTGQFYGILYLFLTASNFFVFGFDVSLNYYVAKKALKTSDAVTITFLMTGISVILSMIIFPVYFQYNTFPEFRLQKLLIYTFLFVAGNVLIVFSGAILTAGNKNHLIGKFTAINNSLLLLLAIVLVNRYAPHPAADHFFTWYFIFYFLQGVLMISLLAGSFRRIAGFRWPPPRLFVKLLRFSGFIFITNFLFYISNKIPVMLAGTGSDFLTSGNYIQAYKLVEYISAMASFLYFPAVAMVAAEKNTVAGERILFLVRISNTFILLVSLLLVATGRILFPWIFGQSFSQVYPIFLYLLPGLLAAGSSPFLTAYFFGTGRVRYNFVSALIMLVSLTVSLVLLPHTMGIMRIAAAFSISGIISFLYDALAFRKFFRYKLADILLLQKNDAARLFLFLKSLLINRNGGD